MLRDIVLVKALLWIALTFLSGQALGSVSFVAAGTVAHSSATTGYTIPAPSGTSNLDVLIAVVSVRADTTITPPSGWASVLRTNNTTGNVVAQEIFYKVAGASEPTSYSFTLGTSARGSAIVLAYRGVDTSAPVIASGGQANSTASSSIAAPAINTAVANAMVIGVFGLANGTATQTPPTGMTQHSAASGSGAGPNGISLLVSGDLQASAGTTGTKMATADRTDTSVGQILALRPLTSLDHYRVQNNTSGVNCQAENVTITAHDSAHTAVTLTNTKTITVTAVRVSGAGGPGNRGDWALVTGSGTLSNGTADDGVATYTFASVGESNIVLALKDTWAQTVNITVTDGSITDTSGTASADASYNQNLVFNASGFRITNGAGVASTISTQTAGTTSGQYFLQAIRTDTNTGACTAAFASGTTVSISTGFTCDNPTTCAGRQVTVTTTAATSNSAATAANNNGASPLSYTALNFLFSTANAEAPFTLNYPDVGQITLNFRHTIALGTGSPSPNTMVGSSNAFVVKPAGFTVTSIQTTAAPIVVNPAAASATGTVFIKAGEDFTATVTAVTSTGAATPNFGKETSAEGVKLTPALVSGLGLTTNPAIANDTVAGSAFTSGVATVTNLSWGEVGIINITPSVGDADYLGVGDVSGSTTGNVGRFTPYDFGIGLNTPAFAPGCSTGLFTYVGQSFGYTTAPVITLTARNKAGGTTQNYTGNWWKITKSSLLDHTYTVAVQALDPLSLPVTGTDPAISDDGGGIGKLTFSMGTALWFARGAPIAPFNADISLAIDVIDDDFVAYSSNPVRFGTATAGNGIAFTGGGKTMRWGRLKLSNALGSEFADLALPAEMQYYNGTSFVTNADDGCMAVPRTAVMFTNFQRNLGACETYLASPPASITFSGGKAALLLKKPGSANNGSVDLKPRLSATDTGTACVNAASGAATNASMSYLQFNWGGGATYDKNPTGRAVFGAPLVPREFIFFRENY